MTTTITSAIRMKTQDLVAVVVEINTLAKTCGF
jgi:hypothetical protein